MSKGPKRRLWETAGLHDTGCGAKASALRVLTGGIIGRQQYLRSTRIFELAQRVDGRQTAVRPLVGGRARRQYFDRFVLFGRRTAVACRFLEREHRFGSRVAFLTDSKNLQGIVFLAKHAVKRGLFEMLARHRIDGAWCSLPRNGRARHAPASVNQPRF